MEKEQRTQKIDEFLEKFDEMIKAANAIEDFKFEIGVTIHSRDSTVSGRYGNRRPLRQPAGDHQPHRESGLL